MAKETNIQNAILRTFSRGKTRLFRNNTLQATAGKVIQRKGTTWVIEKARPVRTGLCVGSSDIIGFKSLEITPEHIGKTLAVFVAIEVKKPGGRLSQKQKTFLSIVKQFGGIAGVAKSESEAAELLK